MLQIFAYYAPIMLLKTVLQSLSCHLGSISYQASDLCLNKLLIIDIWIVLLEYIHNCLSMLTVLLEYIDSHTQDECSIRVYR